MARARPAGSGTVAWTSASDDGISSAAPQAFGDPGGHQQRHGPHGGAGGRGGGEARQPGQESPPGPDPVAEAAGRQQERGQGQGVAVDHPGQPGDVRAERPPPDASPPAETSVH
jgi:hypothetical protein